MTSGTPYNAREIKREVDVIRAEYRRNSRLACQVDVSSHRIEDAKAIDIEFKINEEKAVPGFQLHIPPIFGPVPMRIDFTFPIFEWKVIEHSKHEADSMPTRESRRSGRLMPISDSRAIRLLCTQQVNLPSFDMRPKMHWPFSTGIHFGSKIRSIICSSSICLTSNIWLGDIASVIRSRRRSGNSGCVAGIATSVLADDLFGSVGHDCSSSDSGLIEGMHDANREVT